MKRFKAKAFSGIMAFILLFTAMPSITYAEQYPNGTYSVPVSLSGGSMGHNNVASPCTVTIENGNIYADIIFKRVTPPWHAPRYEWLRTSKGTVMPVVDEANYTNTFYRVPIESLGSVPITTLSSAMSEAHEINYTLYFDPNSILNPHNSGGSSAEGNSSSSTGTSSGGSTKSDDNKDGEDSERHDKDEDTAGGEDIKNTVSVKNSHGMYTSTSKEQLESAKGKSLHLTTSKGDVIFDKAAVESIIKNADGGITLSMKKSKGNKKYISIFELTLKDDKGKTLFKESGSAGIAKIRLKLDKKFAKAKKVFVFDLNKDGEKLSAVYDKKTNSVEFEASYLSKYGVSDKNPSSNYLLYGGMVLIAVGLALFFAFRTVKKRRG